MRIDILKLFLFVIVATCLSCKTYYLESDIPKWHDNSFSNVIPDSVAAALKVVSYNIEHSEKISEAGPCSTLVVILYSSPRVK